MWHVLWLSLVVAPAVPLPERGELKYSFRPSVRQGDVITHDAVTKMKLEMAMGGRILPEVRLSETITFTETIDKLGPDGRVLRMTEAFTRNDLISETILQGKPVRAPNEEGTLAGVAMRLERQDRGQYRHTLIEGKSNPKVEVRLRKGEHFVLGEEMLPTKPLAVGESETVTDPVRNRELSEEFGQNEELDKPPVITLEEVKTVDGRKTAILHEVVQLSGSLPGPGGTPIPMKLDIEIKVTYDLDRNFITCLIATIKGTGTLKQNNTALDLMLTSELMDRIEKR